MQITININDSDKAKAFLNFIKSLDFISVQENDFSYPTLSDKEIIKRVDITNKQIKQGKTIPHEDLYNESENW